MMILEEPCNNDEKMVIHSLSPKQYAALCFQPQHTLTHTHLYTREGLEDAVRGYHKELIRC